MNNTTMNTPMKISEVYAFSLPPSPSLFPFSLLCFFPPSLCLPPSLPYSIMALCVLFSYNYQVDIKITWPVLLVWFFFVCYISLFEIVSTPLAQFASHLNHPLPQFPQYWVYKCELPGLDIYYLMRSYKQILVSGFSLINTKLSNWHLFQGDSLCI